MCVLVGGWGQLTVPLEDKDSGGLYSVMGISEKSKVNCFSKNWVVDSEYHNGLL